MATNSLVKEKDIIKDHLLVKTLLGAEPGWTLRWEPIKATPDRKSCWFLEKGYIMEYLLVESVDRRIVSLFFGPNEFVIRCHPTISQMEPLEDSETQSFDYRGVFGTLRKFPETHLVYRNIRNAYMEKVKRRIFVLQSMTVEERFRDLKKEQPWVLSLAEEEDVASYLGASVEIVRKLKK